MSRVLGCGALGYIGGFPIVTCVPDSTFKSEIDALRTATTDVVGKLVQLTWSNDYEVTSPADNAIPDGEITHYEKTTSSYNLTVLLFHYTDQNGSSHTPVGIKNLRYESGSTIALQDSVIIQGTDYMYVDDGTTGGWGAVIAKDNPATYYVDVIF